MFEDDGSILAFARSGGRSAQVCRANPPYTEWTRTDLDRYVGGPLLAKWETQYLMGGRKQLGDAQPTTVLYWLVDDQLEEIAELASGGDNSYPGFVESHSIKDCLRTIPVMKAAGPVWHHLRSIWLICDWNKSIDWDIFNGRNI